MARRVRPLFIILSVAVILAAVLFGLRDSQAISSPTLTLLSGEGGASFSAETGFNVVRMRLEGMTAGSGETLTERFDGDSVASSFALTDLAKSAI